MYGAGPQFSNNQNTCGAEALLSRMQFFLDSEHANRGQRLGRSQPQVPRWILPHTWLRACVRAGGVPPRLLRAAHPDPCSFPPQPSDFSVSLKASGKNKHFKVQLVDNVYCIGQRRFHTMDELVEHYKKAPIFTSEHGEKLYLVRALQ